jgi:hypothetical protein
LVEEKGRHQGLLGTCIVWVKLDRPPRRIERALLKPRSIV